MVQSMRLYHLFVTLNNVALRDMFCNYLESHGLIVTPVACATDMLRRVHRVRLAPLPLDAGFEKASGINACCTLRADWDRVPIILLISPSDEIERVVGLEMGSDDCVSKPYSARDLLARIRAVLRRDVFTSGAPIDSGISIQMDEFVFRIADRGLQRGNEVRFLNIIEYAMIAELITTAGCHRFTAASDGRVLCA